MTNKEIQIVKNVVSLEEIGLKLYQGKPLDVLKDLTKKDKMPLSIAETQLPE